MNTFLQGCCFVPPEDDNVSTPSFREYSPHSIPSSRLSSRSGYDLKSLGSKEIFYIKRFPKEAWTDFDDERTSLNSSSSLQVLTGSSKSSSTAGPRQRKKDASDRTLFILPEEDKERMSYWLCGTNAQQSMENSYYAPTRRLKSPRRLMTSTSRLLDFISMCFWRCSPGCQQIPTIA